ncbi:MAG TPA: histidine triad nucleotide-binding protein [Chthonomonadaceae bacterium]|nr:histidine triad nucleotide-binding protein [Chthonomonadaceae bacterium]
MPEECVFCKIASKQIPVEPVYEDEEFLAFRDLNPQAPVHVLLIPKKHYPTFLDMEDAGEMGRALQAVQRIATQLGLAEEGFRTVLNIRENGGQTVYHVHFHILGGRFMQWPPG